MEKISIGIDLGTTTTLIAVARDANTLHVLDIFQNNREGKEIESKYLKSVAYFPPIVDSSSNSSEPYVGLQAEYFGQQDSPRFVRTVKRQMGRRILLPVVEKEPYQVAALYLEKALATARRRLSGDMLFTVTVPASFTSNQRADTLRALKLACEKNGVRFPENVGDIFISEPVAAVLAFLDKDIKRPVHLRQLNYNKKTNRLIVYDIGGGTTDLTLVFIETRQEPVKCVTDLSIRVEEISYYNPFGGEDFDLEIAENIYQKFLENYPDLQSLRLSDEERLGVRLQFASIAKDVKEHLSNKYRNSFLLEDDNPFEEEEKQPIVYSYSGEIRVRGNSYICSGEMSWDDLKGCVETLIKTENRRGVISPLRSLLEKSRFSPKEIDGLLLVGGMAQFPLLEEVLKAEFDAEKVWKFDPPDHAIVMGAALYSFLRANSPGFSLDEPAADAYYVWTDKGFDQILPSRTREWVKKEYELKRDTSDLILQIFSGEDAAEDRREEIYHTLIYQGAVRVDLEKEYPKGTKVWVQVRYEGEGSALDHSKLPYLYVWIENPESEPKKVPYSEIFDHSKENMK